MARHKSLTQIFDDGSRLGQDERFIASWNLDRDDWRFAQRMDLFEFRRCKLVAFALVCPELVWDLYDHISCSDEAADGDSVPGVLQAARECGATSIPRA
jgi:hypothetical protein